MSNLTKSQQELADSLLKTNIYAKVRRRKQNANGGFEFYYVMRNTAPVDFRIDPGEFAFVHHEKDPTAPLSPIIINLRNLPPSLISKIALILAEVRLKKRPDCCTGIPNAATPFAKEYAKVSRIPYVNIFAKDDVPGRPRILPAKNALPGKGKSLLIIDDVITKGASKFRAFEVARDLGYNVLGLIVLVDREEGGKETIEKAGFKFYAPFKLSELLKYYLDKEVIDQKQYNEAMEYIAISKTFND